jgi:TRAP-type C4-dicarboxylate transport system substrate-binding protein
VLGEEIYKGLKNGGIEAAKLGTIQMCMVSGAVAGYFKPAMVLDTPYLFFAHSNDIFAFV